MSKKILLKRLQTRVSNNSELKGAHFRILPKKVPILTKNVRFLYYRQANKKRHPPLKVAPMCYKVHVIKHSALQDVDSKPSQKRLTLFKAKGKCF